MAVSPVIPLPQSDVTITTRLKPKPTAVPSSTEGSKFDAAASAKAVPSHGDQELAEQLNEETKRKYVKGDLIDNPVNTSVSPDKFICLDVD